MVSSTACLAIGFVLLWNSGFIGAAKSTDVIGLIIVAAGVVVVQRK